MALLIYKDHCDPGFFLHVTNYFINFSQSVAYFDQLSGAQHTQISLRHMSTCRQQPTSNIFGMTNYTEWGQGAILS